MGGGVSMGIQEGPFKNVSGIQSIVQQGDIFAVQCIQKSLYKRRDLRTRIHSKRSVNAEVCMLGTSGGPGSV